MLKRVLVLPSFFVCSLGLSNPWEDLLKQPTLPTIAQVEEAIKSGTPIPTSWFNGQLNRGGNHSHFETQLKRHMPRAIALFELAYPGATFYELGRDAAQIGDIMDAFYRGLGQSDRVRRLDVSNPTFYETPPAELKRLTQDFLVGNGIDVAVFQNNQKPEVPRIIFDITSFSPHSQSTQLTRSGYKRWVEELGNEPEALLNHFNFISVGLDGGRRFTDFAYQPFDRDAFRKKQALSIRDSMPSQILSCNLLDLAYGGAWHGLFGRFVRAESGLVTTHFHPTTAFDERRQETERKHMLAARKIIVEVVQSETFVVAVHDAAAKMGYRFPLSRVLELTQELPKSEIHETVEQRKMESPQRNTPGLVEGLSPNVEALLENLAGSAGSFDDYTLQARWLTLFDDTIAMQHGLWPKNLLDLQAFVVFIFRRQKRDDNFINDVLGVFRKHRRSVPRNFSLKNLMDPRWKLSLEEMRTLRDNLNRLGQLLEYRGDCQDSMGS